MPPLEKFKLLEQENKTKFEKESLYLRALDQFYEKKYIECIENFEKYLKLSADPKSARYYIETSIGYQIEIYKRTGQTEEIEKLREKLKK